MVAWKWDAGMPDVDGSFGTINTVRKGMCSLFMYVIMVEKRKNSTSSTTTNNNIKKVDHVAKILRTWTIWMVSDTKLMRSQISLCVYLA